jgi:hypothetical protein
LSIVHKIVSWEKKYGFIRFPKEISEFFPKGGFTVIAFGRCLENRSLDKYGRLFIGKPLKDNPNIAEGVTVVISKISEREFSLDIRELPSAPVTKPQHNLEK